MVLMCSSNPWWWFRDCSAVKPSLDFTPSAESRRPHGAEPLSQCGFSATTTGAAPDGSSLLQIAEELGLDADEIEQYGRYGAKIDLSALDHLQGHDDGRIVCVTAVSRRRP
jgi:hypothetical protein